MNLYTPFKQINKLLLVATSIFVLSSCGKDADPTAIKVSSAPITGTGTTLPGGGTTTPGGGTTTPGGGTTTPGDGGGTTTPGTGTTPGTVNSGGNGGVAVGAEGTIVFSLKGTTYTLTNSSSFLVNGVSASAFGFSVSTISGIAMNGQGIQFILGSTADKVGVSDALTVNITLANGTSYSLGGEGKINYNTLTVDQNKMTSKGTFDMMMVNDADESDIVKVAGSFNVK